MFAHIRTVFADVCSYLLAFAYFFMIFCSKNTHPDSLETSRVDTIPFCGAGVTQRSCLLTFGPGLLTFAHVCSYLLNFCDF